MLNGFRTDHRARIFLLNEDIYNSFEYCKKFIKKIDTPEKFANLKLQKTPDLIRTYWNCFYSKTAHLIKLE